MNTKRPLPTNSAVVRAKDHAKDRAAGRPTSRGEGPEESPARVRTLGGVAAALVALVIVVWWPGCRQYPPVTSRENLDLIKLFYAACNTRDPVRLKRAEERFEKIVQKGEISPAEEAGFRRIAELAKAGDWPSAESAALRFAKDQLGQGP